ncbi:L-serine ammonia-lyase [Leminorella grimontii]|uniref:L-serine ammonia-lyase n=1 Tax=Leminorella grimontii TaxID=82981 RepID=UPI0032209473
MISVFEIFKIGIGPSSSHTVGPMVAGKRFIEELIGKQLDTLTTNIVVDIYGSLSLTGKGHHTDIAVIMGLAGNKPDTVDVDAIPAFIQKVDETGTMPIRCSDGTERHVGLRLNFADNALPLHENGLTFSAYDKNILLLSKTYYSTGGGFVVDEENFGKQSASEVEVPYPFYSAKNLLRHCNDNCLSLSAVMMKNEVAMHGREEVERYMAQVWDTMKSAIHRGMNTEGVLPGPLKVPRRASALHRILHTHDRLSTDPMTAMDWVNMFAMAVSEENAAGGRVVTAPTNGACGIIPAVLAYYDHFIQPVAPEAYTRYFLAAGAIGLLFKMNASISGAEVGCQGEIGVACSMASAGLAELRGGSPEKVCNAAEIGMEHNLGLTCDPVAGQVQVPCIERNAIASVKAINSASMAILRTSEPRVSLDKVIETMYETGKDMNAKYRETSRGGLAIKVALCES